MITQGWSFRGMVGAKQGLRCLVTVVFLLGCAAGATENPDNASQQITTIDPLAFASSTPEQDANEGSAPDEHSPSIPDRRDRIFYPGDTERLKPLGRKLLLNILLDQKEIFTSPFRMNEQNAKWWI